MKHKIYGALGLASALIVSSLFNVPHNINNEDLIGPTPINEFSNDFKGELIARNQKENSSIVIPKKIIIHYQLDDGNYANKRFWLWGGDYDPKKEFEATGIDDYGMYIEIDPSVAGDHEEFGFLIFETGNLDASKTEDCILNYEELPPDANGILEVWTYRESDNSVAVFRTIEETMGGKILTANFKDWKKIHVTTSDVAIGYRLYCFTNEYYNYKPNGRRYFKEKFKVKDYKFDKECLEFDIDFMAHSPASVVYAIEVDFKDINKPNGNPDGSIALKTKMKFVDMTKLYGTNRFRKFYNYYGDDLGAIYTPEKTTFKVWAPMCARATLRIYNGGTAHMDTDYDLYRMSLTAGGVWSCEVPGDLNGKYYTYHVANFSGEEEVCDPYAKAVGFNGVRGMILDFDTTDPEGWNEVPDIWEGKTGFDLKAPNDLTVYETHIRDLTMHVTWKGRSLKGTYSAFIEKGTTYSENGITVTTGFDHIEELGVNAVQILPFFDSANKEDDPIYGNDKIDSAYNWGYNPLNYNAPDGQYSSNPFNGDVRVKEIKEMVKAFATNKNHTRVIMDVVYNHVGSVTTSNFTKLMPRYYFRTNSDGAYMNASGCGNDVKTEAPMMRKFIVDSVKWWASEYKIKGFRFDLMGLIDCETMRQVKDELHKLDPDIVCYGEGWPWPNQQGYPCNKKGAYTDNIYSKLYPSPTSPGILGGFSDTFRNAIRGGNGWGMEKTPEYGFIAQGKEHVGDKSAAIALGIRGMHKDKGGNPYQTVNYASCHDNYALYDQLHFTLGTESNTIEPDYNVLTNAILAVQSAVAFSNGIAFFNGGEELLHSKIDPEGTKGETTPMYGQKISHNSYKSSDATNCYDYSNKISIDYKGETHDTASFFAKYKEMIAKRAEFESRHGYKEGMNDTAQWFANTNESDPNSSQALGVYWDYNGSKYWMFMSGAAPVQIGFDASNRSTLIYNSLNGEDTYICDGKDITMSARQFLVFKGH